MIVKSWSQNCRQKTTLNDF